jgi:hypothetical protein
MVLAGQIGSTPPASQAIARTGNIYTIAWSGPLRLV